MIKLSLASAKMPIALLLSPSAISATSTYQLNVFLLLNFSYHRISAQMCKCLSKYLLSFHSQDVLLQHCIMCTYIQSLCCLCYVYYFICLTPVLCLKLFQVMGVWVTALSGMDTS